MSVDPEKARAIFVEAVGRGPAERADLLAARCSGDDDLRRHVENLLRVEDEAGSFLDRPAAAAGPTDTHRPARRDGSPDAGTVVGPYKLVEAIGEGGMGEVWLAQQQEPVKRLVALKVIKAGMDTRQVVARFEAERQALALMDHPHIAKVHDAGTTPDGRPFFVMELVKGVPITRYCDDHRLTPRERLELFLPVCHAVQHAHQKGVIHRDLKPSNVLVALYDDRPVPKVIDFGVAKATGQQLTEKTLHTGFGAVVGTVEYMSPEQAGFNQLDIDTRSDVYSLGVLLYELLAGSPPFSKRDLERAGVLEMLRVIREQEPSKPSTKLSTADGLPTLAANRGTEPAKLTKLVRGELDWIVMKALEKDRTRRYETANGFAMDVQRYLAGEAVQAVPRSAGYRLRKFARRNKGPIVAAGLVLATLVLGIIGTSIGMWRAEQRRVEAEQAKREAQAAKTRAEEAEVQTLAEFRASTDDAVEQLIGSKPELGPQERTYLEKTLKRWQVFADRQGDDERSMAVRSEGQFRVAFLWGAMGRRKEARNEYETARDLKKKLVAQFPDVLVYQHGLANTHDNLGLLLRDLGEHDAARKEHEAARDLKTKLVAQFPDVPVYQHDLAKTHNNSGGLLTDLGEYDAARKAFEAACELAKKLAAKYPAYPEYQRTLAINHTSLGWLLTVLGERDAARKEYQAAHDLRTKLVAQYPAIPAYQQELAATHNDLGAVLRDPSERDAARKEHEAARDLLEKLVAQYPAIPAYQQGLATTHNALVAVLRDLGERDAARKEHEAARNLQKKLVARHPTVPVYQQDLAKTHVNLGILLHDFGEHDAARKEYEAARDLQKKLVAQYSGVPAHQNVLAKTHVNLGLALHGLGERDAARIEFEAAQDLQKKLVAQHPAVPAYQEDLAKAHLNLGVLLNDLGERDAARREYEAAHDLQKKLGARYPAIPEYQHSLAKTHFHLGNLLDDYRLHDAARKEYETARDIQMKLVARFPGVPVYQSELAQSHNNLGMKLNDLGKRVAARKEFEAAQDLQKKLVAQYPAVRLYQHVLAKTHVNLAFLLHDLGERDAARKDYHAAIDLQKKLVVQHPTVLEYQIELGGAYCNLGLFVQEDQPAESLPWFDQAINILEPIYRADQRDAPAKRFLRNCHRSRAQSYGALKNHAAALKDWDRAVELSPPAEQSAIRAHRATSRLLAGQVTEAVAEVAELTRSARSNAGQWYNFACFYAVASGKIADRKQEYADRAMELLHQAVKAGYKDAAHMKKDSDLDPLREREDFKKLLAELEAKKK